MKQSRLGIIVAIGLTLPAFGEEAVKVPDGIYQLNYAKSTIRGPFPKSLTINTVGETSTVVGFGPNDKPYTIVLPLIIDGKPHPITGSPVVDTETRTHLDMYTSSIKRTKEGKLVQAGYEIFNPQTNTFTLSLSFVDTPNSYVLVFEKQ
jgi:hypothetical protein